MPSPIPLVLASPQKQITALSHQSESIITLMDPHLTRFSFRSGVAGFLDTQKPPDHRGASHSD